ncbi:hypothetical protein GCM10027615_01000 [Plantactinospora veratri]
MPSTLSRLVASAATVIATSGSIAQPPVRWSETETESKPRSSIRRISSRHRAAGRSSPGIAAVNRNGRTPAGPGPGAADDPVRGGGDAGAAVGARGCAGGIARLYWSRGAAPGVPGRSPGRSRIVDTGAGPTGRRIPGRRPAAYRDRCADPA